MSLDTQNDITYSYDTTTLTASVYRFVGPRQYEYNAVTIPNSITVSDVSYLVTNIGIRAFRDSYTLTSIVIPDSVTNIGEAAFGNCIFLTSVTIGNSVTNIGEFAFSECHALESIVIPNSVTNIDINAFRGCHTLTSIVIPDSVININQLAFAYCNSLTSVTIGNSVTNVGPAAFGVCRALTSIVIPNSVININQLAFAYCIFLTSVTIGNSVTNIGNSAFESCQTLTSIVIPNSVTNIGEAAFRNCHTLTSVFISSSNGLGITSPNSSVSFYGAIVNLVVPTSSNLYAAGYTVSQLYAAGYTVSQLYNAGFTVPQLYDARISQTEIMQSNICFPAGTPISTNQGNISIELLDPEIHTIRNKKIVGVTQIITPDKYLVCFEKDALGPNIPSQKTTISKNHEILYNEKMTKAEDFVSKFENVKKIKYSGEVLYNVLMEEHDKMMVNNLNCETLHPENSVAQLYKILQILKPDQRVNTIKQFNEYVTKHNTYSSEN